MVEEEPIRKIADTTYKLVKASEEIVKILDAHEGPGKAEALAAYISWLVKETTRGPAEGLGVLEIARDSLWRRVRVTLAVIAEEE